MSKPERFAILAGGGSSPGKKCRYMVSINTEPYHVVREYMMRLKKEIF